VDIQASTQAAAKLAAANRGPQDGCSEQLFRAIRLPLESHLTVTRGEQ
jgi:hypothetical protein